MNFVQDGNEGGTIIFGYAPVDEVTFKNVAQWVLSFKIGVNTLVNQVSDLGQIKMVNYTDNRDMAIITAPSNGLFADASGPDLSLENVNGTWSTTTTLTGVRLFTDNSNSAKYGFSVDASESGKYIVIGGIDADGYTGAALLYTRNGNNWNLVRKINGASNNPASPLYQPPGSRYGYNTCINKSGDVLMLTGPYDENGVGAALIYTGTNWNTPAYKITGVDFSLLGLGADINADGSVIVLGGGSPFTSNGGVNIFTGSKNLGWKISQSITGENSEQLGRVCSINDGGDVIALASYYNGYVGIYTGNATNKWSLAQKISGSQPYTPGNNYQSSFALNLSLNQDASVIAFSEVLYYEYNNFTKTYIYTGNAQSKWSLDADLTSDFYDSNAEAVSVNAQGGTVAVYSRQETLAGFGGYEGAVNIFKKS